jgi:CspA family cold shock protein
MLKSIQWIKGRFTMLKGTIRRLVTDRGFGFIQTTEGKEIFFHRSELQDVQFADLREGQEVEFETSRGRDGRQQAVRVRLVQPKSE